MEKYSYYRATVVDGDGKSYSSDIKVNNISPDENLWATVYMGSSYLDIRMTLYNKPDVDDETMYKLGFRKVVCIKKVTVIEEEDIVYER